MRYLIDFETQSSLNLNKVGVKRYLNTPDSDIVCMSYKLWDEVTDKVYPTKLWLPGTLPPFVVKPTDRFYAHNAQFDYEVWHTLGNKYLFNPFPIEQCVDVMALCGRYTYPQGLGFVGKVLRLEVQKSRRGGTLMRKICNSPFKYTERELHEFYGYCVRDLDTMYELIRALPRDELEPIEQKIWVMTAKINRRGIPVDVTTINRIHEAVEFYKNHKMKDVNVLTEGKVDTVNQVGAIVSFAKEKGVNIPDLQADTVVKFLETKLPDTIRKLLTLRQELGRTSTAKYLKLKEQTYEGRIFENLRYYGAATGRWSGMGFQVHNLPRATVDDVEDTITKFMDGRIMAHDPVKAAKALIRSMIKASKGKKICAVDYKAIENVLLLFVAEEENQLQVIRDGKEHYKQFASAVYNVSYMKVTDEQRFLGKVGILGAGYNAGAHGFLKFALGYGLNIDFEQADGIIQLYRKEHPKVKKLWYALKDCCIAAIDHRGAAYAYNNCIFKVIEDRNNMSWLTIKIPSGRTLVYNSPELREDSYGMVPTHMGVNSYTKQWSRLKLIPGRITENIIQALARDILAHAKLKLMDEGYDVIGSVHDEVILEVEEDQKIKPIIDIMTALPEWGKRLPLEAEGFIERRYRKA